MIGSSHPVLSRVGDEAILPCHVEPPADMERGIVEWNRPDLKPQFVLLYRTGRYLNAEQNLLYKDRASLFDTELSRGNISLRLSRVRLSDEGNYTCFAPELRSSTKIQLLVGKI